MRSIMLENDQRADRREASQLGSSVLVCSGYLDDIAILVRSSVTAAGIFVPRMLSEGLPDRAADVNY